MVVVVVWLLPSTGKILDPWPLVVAYIISTPAAVYDATLAANPTSSLGPRESSHFLQDDWPVALVLVWVSIWKKMDRAATLGGDEDAASFVTALLA